MSILAHTSFAAGVLGSFAKSAVDLAAAQPWAASQRDTLQLLATILSALTGLVALLLVREQTGSGRSIAGCEFVLDYSREYAPTKLQDARARLAKTLILYSATSGEPLKDPTELYRVLRSVAGPVLKYFEELGMMVRHGLIPAHLVLVANYARTVYYYELLRHYIVSLRKEDRTYYQEFEFLYKKLRAVHDRKAQGAAWWWLQRCGDTMKRMLGLGLTPPERVSGNTLRRFLLREMNVRIRPFEKSDAERTLIPSTLRATLLKAHEDGEFVAVAEVLDRGDPDHEYLGYVLGTTVQSHGRTVGLIKQMYVDSRFRGIGLGKKLSTHFEQRLRQWDITDYEVVVPTADLAVAFYEKLGFDRGEPVPHLLGAGVDGYRMNKVLAGLTAKTSGSATPTAT